MVELTDLTCASPGYVEYLYISFAIPSTEDISYGVNTSFLSIDYILILICNDRFVCMPAFGVWSELEWPAGVRSITMDFITGPLPEASTLEFLRMGLVEGCLPLSERTVHFTLHLWTPCIPNWPDSLVSLSSGSSVPITEANATYCSVLNPPSRRGVFVDTDGDGEPARRRERNRQPMAIQWVWCDGGVGVAPGVYVVNACCNYPYLQSITPATHSADVR